MKRLLVYLMLSTLLISNGFTQSTHSKQKINLDKSGLAIEGYDPVAYFRSGKAIPGKKEFAIAADGVMYRFSNAEHRELFKADPGKYQPQYGGWCAYAMGAKGELVSVDPETFKVLNGKLYLFYNKFFNNTLKEWNKAEQSLKMKADQNWSKFDN
ncbi:YHS domain-containing (seleno)protein [Pedobacter foliorum]|uniref:YHS domain-containing (seleno)protein n=1 Tax=Pedobacter foliorum TaxID=2739058 RepID=UPI00156732D2|nr:YHS domain-containing (seleno)protein [Pedobacter foliorum]NRF37660.1 YHS domain protein [Pedobacter foliorum]